MAGTTSLLPAVSPRQENLVPSPTAGQAITPQYYGTMDVTTDQVADPQQYQKGEFVPGQYSADVSHEFPSRSHPGTAAHANLSQNYMGQVPPVQLAQNDVPAPTVLLYSGQQSNYVVRSQSGEVTAVLVALDISYIKSIPGILQLCLFISLTVAMSCVVEVGRQCGIQGRVKKFPRSITDKVNFSMFGFISGWMVVLLFLVTRFTQLHKSGCFAKVKQLWLLVYLILYFLWMVLTLFAAALLASLEDVKTDDARLNAYIDTFRTSIAFGFISGFIFLLCLCFYFIEFCKGIFRGTDQNQTTAQPPPKMVPPQATQLSNAPQMTADQAQDPNFQEVQLTFQAD